MVNISELFQKIKNFVLQNLGIIIVLSILLAVVLIVFFILTLLLPNPLDDIVFWVLIFMLGRYICRLLTFPGSSWFWKRYLENHFCKALSNKSLDIIQCLLDIIQILQKKKNSQGLKNSFKTQVFEIKKMIQQFNFTFNKQRQLNPLSKYQLNLMKKLLSLETLLNETYVKCIETNTYLSIWELMDENQLFFNLLKNSSLKVSIEPSENGEKISECCLSIIDKLYLVVGDLKFFQRIKTWLFNDSLGTLDQFRIELESRYNSQRILLTSYDNRILDCLFVFGKFNDISNSSEAKDIMSSQHAKNIEIGSVNFSEGSLESRGGDIGPTIIFCNPNAGYYEYMYYKSDWLDYYVRNGINVFLWNYRGYGNTKGTPTPEKLLKDAEMIYDFLKTNMNLKKIGLHGESLGGIIATHIAATKNVDFICVDKSFSSLYNVAKCSYGYILGTLYYILVYWTQSYSNKYTVSSTYKVITMDPKDTIIPIQSSLCTDVMYKYLAFKYENDKKYGKEIRISETGSIMGKIYKVLRKIGWQSVYLRNLFFEAYEKTKVQSFVERYYQSYISADDCEKFIEALTRISRVVLEISKLKQYGAGLISKRSSRRSKSVDNANQLVNDSMDIIKQKKDKTKHSRESSYDFSNLTARDDSLLNDSKLEYLKKLGDNYSKLNPNEQILAELNSKNGTPQSQDEFGKVEDYSILINEEDLQSDIFQNFIMKIFSTFDILDSFGLTLNDIFMNYTTQRESLFKKFVIGLEIWGSHLPFKVNLKKKSLEPDFHQRLAVIKMRAMINKLEQILKEQKSYPMNQISTNILIDLDLVVRSLKDIKIKLQEKLYLEEKVHQNLGSQVNTTTLKTIIENGITKVEGELENLSEKRDLAERSNIINDEDKLELQKIRLSFHNQRQQKIGYLIILSCGHNGVFNQDEVSLYEMHLKEVGFILAKEIQTNQ